MPVVEALDVNVYTVPTVTPESDGTACWAQTSMVVVRLWSGGVGGLGYSYAHPAAARIVESPLRDLVVDFDVHATEAAWIRMGQAIRNFGRPGIAMAAVSAVDSALWDLKARLLGLPLADLLGRVRDGILIYGSGGFTNYSMEHLAEQLSNWAAAGIRVVKMKVGTWPGEDVARVRQVRRAVGEGARIFVDANGAYGAKQALAFAEEFQAEGVVWFEEPVSSDDLEGLAFVRAHGPGGMDVAAGEYGHDPSYFRRMLAAGAVDVLQADATRCGGVTGWMKAAALAEGFHIGLSAHTAPALHQHVCCAAAAAVNLEYFYDHVRIEEMLFDGVTRPRGGFLHPDPTRAGNGLELKTREAARFAA